MHHPPQKRVVHLYVRLRKYSEECFLFGELDKKSCGRSVRRFHFENVSLTAHGTSSVRFLQASDVTGPYMIPQRMLISWSRNIKLFRDYRVLPYARKIQCEQGWVIHVSGFLAIEVFKRNNKNTLADAFTFSPGNQENCANHSRARIDLFQSTLVEIQTGTMNLRVMNARASFGPNRIRRA